MIFHTDRSTFEHISRYFIVKHFADPKNIRIKIKFEKVSSRFVAKVFSHKYLTLSNNHKNTLKYTKMNQKNSQNSKNYPITKIHN